ncbi:MAG: ASPIC/UnbV domain-containing protein [Lewinellaceae bacterium]|nr:ASPIC/UnbV domain-containing protein [Lewinellaceae bacterium]
MFEGKQVQYAENQPVRGFQSSVEPGVILFGLGDTEQVDSLLVSWPGDK